MKPETPNRYLNAATLNPISRIYQRRKKPVILPHHLIHYLHKEGISDIDEAASRHYWQHIQKFTEWGAGHPCSADPSDLVIGTFVYGDDIKFNNNEKLTAVDLGYVLAEKKVDSMKTHHPLFVVREATGTVYDIPKLNLTEPMNPVTGAELRLCYDPGLPQAGAMSNQQNKIFKACTK